MAFLIFFIITIFSIGNASTSDSILNREKAILLSANSDKQDIIIDKLKDIEKQLSKEQPLWEKLLLNMLGPVIVSVMAYLGITQQAKVSTISKFQIDWAEQLRSNYSEFYVSVQQVGHKIRSGQLSIHNYTVDSDAEKMLLMRMKIKLMLTHSRKTNPEHVDFWIMLIDYSDQLFQYYSNGIVAQNEEIRIDQIRIDMEDILLDIIEKEREKAWNFKS